MKEKERGGEIVSKVRCMIVELFPKDSNFKEDLQKLLNENFVVENRLKTGVRYNVFDNKVYDNSPAVVLNAIIERFDGTIEVIITFTDINYEWLMTFFIDKLQEIAIIKKIEFAKNELSLVRIL